jgi:hypothetical protein
MKILILSIIVLQFTVLKAQNITFTKQLSGAISKDPVNVQELPNKDFLVIVNEYPSQNGSKTFTKLYFLSPNGGLKDSITFIDSLKSLEIAKLIPTNYGYCLIGQMRQNELAYFWNAKLDAQFRIISQQFTPTNSYRIIMLNYTITKDSGIAIIIPLVDDYTHNAAKINKQGELTMYNPTKINYSIPTSIFERKDSAGYLLLNYYEWQTTDSVFNIKYRRNLNVFNTSNNYSPNLQPTGLRKNDSTFFYAGRWIQINGRRNRDLVFMVINKLGDPKYVKTIESAGDTSYRQAGINCIDTTKDGRFIYWGGTYNFDSSNPPFSLNNAPFILTKLDTAYRIVWQKKYGLGANCPMEGVLATSDGGCLMYGYRYDYNSVPKVDAYLIKVDGNGVVTSTTSIPILHESIIAYPNPSNGQLHFKKEDPSVSRTFELNIFDMSGKLVFQKKETDLSEIYYLNYLATGDYMYQIKQKEQIISIGKWVKID